MFSGFFVNNPESFRFPTSGTFPNTLQDKVQQSAIEGRLPRKHTVYFGVCLQRKRPYTQYAADLVANLSEKKPGFGPGPNTSCSVFTFTPWSNPRALPSILPSALFPRALPVAIFPRALPSVLFPQRLSQRPAIGALPATCPTSESTGFSPNTLQDKVPQSATEGRLPRKHTVYFGVCLQRKRPYTQYAADLVANLSEKIQVLARG
ncbi:MAG: hypothetical protein K6F58_01305, partial [Bacteroidales bacterium]|nr:hypothetical protein [Bacteroidales bacterium]